MYAVEPNLFQAVSECAHRFQGEIEQLAQRHALTIEGGLPALELQVHPQFQALLEYNLWGEAGLVVIHGKLHKRDHVWTDSFSVMMKFSLTHDPKVDIEGKKQRIEEFLYGEGEYFWNIPPAGHVGHSELTLRFTYQPGTNRLAEYVRSILGIVTGKMMAA
ncbi:MULTISPECIES: hypothetical protein [Brevibacillus]|uniref:hypothetical protein n=1 Tax=Brevibacillus TaxID=55080 RepID=UPI0007D8B431|nr:MULTISPECIES: hypothetical protein [Bacillales]NRR01582.1 hypothetical protein [Brevibacillus sp. RS1.1]TQR34023.1 hypothetical protein C7Y45_18705 [Lysinibacillus sp. SDF0063]UIO40891.1 hypothetical protein LOY85_19070 [Brevibacillus brevis]WGV58407.1 hypothetical protein QIH01_23450 [Brevibacillus brevis]